MTVAIHIGDCRDVLPTLPDESVHCVVTSPPYWGLRDYGTAKWEGGDAACDHSESKPSRKANAIATSGLDGGKSTIHMSLQFKGDCGHCGAVRVDQQLGLEPDFRAYVAAMVEVFREVKRVLRSDGVCFLNLGDSYCSRDTILEYKLRKDLSLTELQHVALAMFGVRITEDEASGKGALPEVLSDIVQGQAICDQPTLASGRVEEKLSEASSGSNCENGSAKQTDKDRRDNGAGRQMLLLWGDDPAIPDIGSHQRGWCGPSEKDGAVNHSDLSASAPRRLSETQISHSVFQLQLRDRIMGLLSARKFTEAEISASVRACFKASSGLKPKDLVGIPWRVAFALQEDGWYLRQDIIWSKPNPMPESVTDRCTKAHEYMFLLAKSQRYYYDADAIKEPDVAGHSSGNGFAGRQGLADYRPQLGSKGLDGNRRTGEEGTAEQWIPGGGRNKRSVWTIGTEAFPEAHFATFPPALIEPCIEAGCPIGGTVLDPFAGAGTTGLVADRLQRNAILIELNPDYSVMSERRIVGDAPLFADVRVQT